MKKIKLLVASMFMLVGISAFGAGAQLNLLETQIPAAQSVTGVRLNVLYGKTANMTGLDLHILAIGESNNFKGVQFPLFLGANIVNNNFLGLGLGLANIHKGQSTGAILGLVNLTTNVRGVQWGAVNIANGETMVDLGLVNISEGAVFQLGLFNMTRDLKGVQIGLINVAKTGFLPIFPFINIDGRLF